MYIVFEKIFKIFCCDVNRCYGDGTHFCTHFFVPRVPTYLTMPRRPEIVLGYRSDGSMNAPLRAVSRDGYLLSVLGSLGRFSAQCARFFSRDTCEYSEYGRMRELVSLRTVACYC